MTEEKDKKDSVLETALSYFEAGVTCVALYGPHETVKYTGDGDVTHPGKQPTYLGWQKKEASSDLFLQHYRPGNNIGVVTGKRSGFIVLDCDKKKSGMEWFTANEMHLGRFVKEHTGSGGLHLYYAYPEGFNGDIPSKVDFFPGVDLLADSGTQVVTAPSVHVSGGVYAFENGLNVLDVPFEADEPPEWILEAIRDLQRKKAQKEAEEKYTSDLPVDMPYEIRRCRDELATYPGAVEGQGGDIRTYSAAVICKAYNLSQRQAFDLLLEVYNPRCSPPWSREDLMKKVRNAYRYGPEGGQNTTAADFPDETPEELEKAIEDIRPEDTYSPKLPIASARHFIARNPGKVLCDQGQLYVYRTRNGHWDIVEDEMFEAIVLRDVDKESSKTAKNLRMGQLRDIARAVKRQLQADNPEPLIPDTWLDGRTGHFVSLENGILDVGTGELMTHSREWFSFTRLPFSYDPDARCPRFLEFLESVWDGDQELIESMKLWMGYVLTSDMSAQKFAVLIGESRAGKSTLARVMEALVGKKNTAACSLMQFGGDFGLEPLLGKRLAIFNDAQKLHGAWGDVATERIISIVGNDPQPVNRKNRGIVTVHIPAKIMFVCNDIPHFVNKRDALTNRMLVFPFRKSFKGKEDPTLHDTLMSELPGILNWALEGARAVMEGEKLKHSKAGEQAVEEIAEILDSIRGFISDCVRFTTEASFVSSRNIFEAYKEWCRDANMGCYGMKRFFQEFKSKCGENITAARSPDKVRLKGYYGLKLDPEGLSEFGDLTSFEDDDDQSDIPF